MVGTALRAVRNDAPLMLRWRFIAARSASAPYHLSHWAQDVGSCCLCCFLILISSVAFAAPRLIVPSDGIAFGEVAVGSNVVGKVVLRNEGSATVAVSRVKACCGAKAELSAMKIPPKGSATLSVSLTPQEIGAFSKSIQIACDDPERPILSVPVSGVVVAPPAAEGRWTPSCENIVRTVLVAFICVGAAFLVWKGRRRFSVRRCLEGVCRVCLGGLFAYAGAMKLCDVSAFAGLLSRYERPAPSHPLTLARRPATRRTNCGIMLAVDATPGFQIPLSRVCAACGAAVAWVAREPAAGGSGAGGLRVPMRVLRDGVGRLHDGQGGPWRLDAGVGLRAALPRDLLRRGGVGRVPQRPPSDGVRRLRLLALRAGAQAGRRDARRRRHGEGVFVALDHDARRRAFPPCGYR